jgi:hypothetical protein
VPGVVAREVCNFLVTFAVVYSGSAVDYWVLPNVMACLRPHGVGVSCLKFVRIASWSIVWASVSVVMLFGSLMVGFVWASPIVAEFPSDFS